MGFDDRRIIELLLGLVFVGFLLFAALVVIYGSESNPSSKQSAPTSYTIIQNSYNEDSYNSYPIENIRVSRNYEDYNYRDYSRHRNDDYFSYGEHKKEETFFNNYKDEFRVHVVNKGEEDRYFKVKFYFCDYEENCFIETMNKYIHAGEEEIFIYIDIHAKRYKYADWEYKVFPEN